MRDDRNDDLRDRPVEEEQLGDEEITRGREVEDIVRKGETHGVDVVTDAERPDIADTGRTVVDHSHVVEQRGVDVIDEGPVNPNEG